MKDWVEKKRLDEAMVREEEDGDAADEDCAAADDDDESWSWQQRLLQWIEQQRIRLDWLQDDWKHWGTAKDGTLLWWWSRCCC